MADSRDARRGQLIAVWAGIGLGGGAAAFAESLLVEERLGLALAVTTLLALALGVVISKWISARHARHLITVKDLRGK